MEVLWRAGYLVRVSTGPPALPEPDTVLLMYREKMLEAGVEVAGPPRDEPWGHCTIRMSDPDGVSIALYSVISAG